MKSTHASPSPFWKPLLPQSPPLLDRSAYHLNLPTCPPTSNLLAFLAMLTSCFHGSKPISYNSNLVVGNLFIIVLFNLKIKIIILILFYWFICRLKRYSVPLYYKSWCEESLIKWEDVTENWSLGEALEPLIMGYDTVALWEAASNPLCKRRAEGSWETTT